jgi:hypothetical protein
MVCIVIGLTKVFQIGGNIILPFEICTLRAYIKNSSNPIKGCPPLFKCPLIEKNLHKVDNPCVHFNCLSGRFMIYILIYCIAVRRFFEHNKTFDC